MSDQLVRQHCCRQHVETALQQIALRTHGCRNGPLERGGRRIPALSVVVLSISNNHHKTPRPNLWVPNGPRSWSRGSAHGKVREISIGLTQPAQEECTYAPNVIITSKYTVWNFVPKNTIEQLLKAANLYFLIMSVIMSIGEDGRLYVGTIKAYSTFLTLLAMMVVTAVIAATDDHRRHIADAQTNSQQAERVSL